MALQLESLLFNELPNLATPVKEEISSVDAWPFSRKTFPKGNKKAQSCVLRALYNDFR
jgi:hypothetical protein